MAASRRWSRAAPGTKSRAEPGNPTLAPARARRRAAPAGKDQPGQPEPAEQADPLRAGHDALVVPRSPGRSGCRAGRPAVSMVAHDRDDEALVVVPVAAVVVGQAVPVDHGPALVASPSAAGPPRLVRIVGPAGAGAGAGSWVAQKSSQRRSSGSGRTSAVAAAQQLVLVAGPGHRPGSGPLEWPEPPGEPERLPVGHEAVDVRGRRSPGRQGHVRRRSSRRSGPTTTIRPQPYSRRASIVVSTRARMLAAWARSPSRTRTSPNQSAQEPVQLRGRDARHDGRDGQRREQLDEGVDRTRRRRPGRTEPGRSRRSDQVHDSARLRRWHRGPRPAGPGPCDRSPSGEVVRGVDPGQDPRRSSRLAAPISQPIIAPTPGASTSDAHHASVRTQRCVVDRPGIRPAPRAR